MAGTGPPVRVLLGEYRRELASKARTAASSLSAIGAHLRNERYYRLPLLMALAWRRCRTRRFSTLQIWLLDTFPASQSVITLNLFLPRCNFTIKLHLADERRPQLEEEPQASDSAPET